MLTKAHFSASHWNWAITFVEGERGERGGVTTEHNKADSDERRNIMSNNGFRAFRVALKARQAEQQVYHTPRNKRNACKWWWIYRKASPCQSQRISAQSSEATKSTRERFVYTEYRFSNGGWGEHRAVSIEILLWWIFDDFFWRFHTWANTRAGTSDRDSGKFTQKLIVLVMVRRISEECLRVIRLALR